MLLDDTIAIEDFRCTSRRAGAAIVKARSLIQAMCDRLHSDDKTIDSELLLLSRELAIDTQFLYWPLMVNKPEMAAVRIGHDYGAGPANFPSAHVAVATICGMTLLKALYVFIPAIGEGYLLNPLSPCLLAKEFLDAFGDDFGSDSALPIVNPENLPTRIEEMFVKETNRLPEFNVSELASMVARERAVVIEDLCKNDRLVLPELTGEASVFWLCANDAYRALQLLRDNLPYGTVGTLDFSQLSPVLLRFIDSARRALNWADEKFASRDKIFNWADVGNLPQDQIVNWLEMRLGRAEKFREAAGSTVEAHSSWPLTEADDRDEVVAKWIDHFLQNPILSPPIAISANATESKAHGEPLADDPCSPESPVPAPSTQTMSVDEANKKAMELADAAPSFLDKKQREWAKAIGCSTGTVSKMLLWEKTMEKTGRGRKDKPKKPKTVSLTNSVEATQGEGEKHEVLEDIIRQQKADPESSPLDPDGKSPVVYRD